MHIVIVRTGGSIIDYKTYNCQEVGLAKTLANKGYKVSVILAGKQYEQHQIPAKSHSIDIYYLTYKSINQSLSLFNGLEKLLDSISPDIIQVHEFGMLMSYATVRWAKKRNVKCVLIQGSYRETQKPIFKQLEQVFNNTFGRYILRHVDGIGCKTEMASEYVKRYFDTETCLTPIGLDVTKFQDTINRDWRTELGVVGKKVLLYVGSLEPRRNPKLLLKVAQELPSDYILLMVGSGVDEYIVKELIASCKSEDKVRLLGKLNQEELPSLYSISDLFLLMSDYEIYGMVILEAMYFGLPVISTLTAGSEVLIDSDMNGVIIDNKDVKIWSDTIQRVCNDKALLMQMKKSASNKIKQELTWDKASYSFISLYQQVKR